jgi:regulator of sirC expression with transglutaminase-like and TPR domain
MDVSGWNDAAAVEAWLGAQARRPDGALDLAAMALALAAHARPGLDARPYAAHLDALAADAESSAPPALEPAEQAAALNRVLFARAGYRGDRETYDDLANADLARVIDRRKGLPIALSILYLHVARSLGWPAAGVNFPRHFLVRLGTGADGVFADPFEEGAVRTAGDLAALLKGMQGDEAVLAPEHLALAGNRDILLRLQNNIKTRCLKAGDVAAGLATVERMALVAPASPAVWYEAASLNAEIGQLRRARACLDEVARTDRQRRFAGAAEELLQRLKARLN